MPGAPTVVAGETLEPAATVRPAPRIRIDRHELAGAFGDVGTDLPLLVAMIPAAGLTPAAVFLLFGLAQIGTGLVYGLPMPMQPLKAMAVIVIAGGLPGSVLFGGGLAIGALMLVLAATGLLGWLVGLIPQAVVRGVQLGLALSLGRLALTRYLPAMGGPGYALAAVSALLLLLLWGNRRLPGALPVMALGVVVALWSGLDVEAMGADLAGHLPTIQVPAWNDVWTGLWVLALPQLPLSLSNSVIATHRTLADLFPHRAVSVRKIGLTYAVTNLVLPLFGGVPLCHGSGGLAGHHAFGGRTGGSVVIYGALLAGVGLVAGGAAAEVVRLFPLPVFGVVLLFEAFALGALARDVLGTPRGLGIAALVALAALLLPQGYVVGVVAGTLADWLLRRRAGPRG